MQSTPIAMVDTLIRDTIIVTMDQERRILKDAAIAITGDRISHVGKTADILPQVEARTAVGLFDAVYTRGRHIGWPILTASGVFAILGATA